MDRRRLAAGGNRIRTIGPAAAKGSAGRCQSGRRHDQWNHLRSGPRSRGSTWGGPPMAVPFAGGPPNGQRFPPPASLNPGEIAATFRYKFLAPFFDGENIQDKYSAG